MGRERAGERRWRLGLVAIVAAVVLSHVSAAPASAHWADVAVAEVAVGERQTEITLTFPTGLAPFADDNKDGAISSEEVRAHQGELEALLGRQIRLRDGRLDGTLAVQPAQMAPVRPNLNMSPSTHSTLLLTYTWSRPVQELTIHYGLFLPGVPTASALAIIVQNGQARSFVFTPENREITLSGNRSPLWQQALSFVVLGTRHILTGYDHVLFLLSLLMLGGGLRGLLKVVTAFTLAHSFTLSLAVLDVVTLAPRLVESGIALSIAYVAAENLWRKDKALRDRWLITFAFGLIHGLGFASILKEMALPRASLATSLVGFNLGVEIGQIAIVTAAYLGLRALGHVPWDQRFRRLVSAAAAVTGLVWFVQRAFVPF